MVSSPCLPQDKEAIICEGLRRPGIRPNAITGDEARSLDMRKAPAILRGQELEVIFD